MDLTSILVQLVSGAIGGNLGGLLNKAKSLGPLVNTILGAIGGVGGGQLLGRRSPTCSVAARRATLPRLG